MSRGGPMGGRGGFHPGMRGRGILRGVPPRGMAYHHRGGPPRGGGPPSRGRPPMYNTPPHHQQNNHHQSMSSQGPPPSSQPPPPAEGTPPVVASSTTTSSLSTVKTVTSGSAGSPPNGTTGSGPSPSSSQNGPQTSNSQTGSGPPPSRGAPRGRGGPTMSRGGRGGYTPNINVSGSSEMSGPPPQKPYRGGPPRGRGGYSLGMSRPPPVIQPGMTQGAPVPSLKRGPPTGPIGAKRGRYDQGGPPARPYMPKYPTYNQQQQVPTHPPQHNSYHNQSSQIQRYDSLIFFFCVILIDVFVV